MKNVLKFYLMLLLPILVGSGCEDESNDSFELTQQRLIGDWMEGDSLRFYSFDSGGTITRTHSYNNDIFRYSYRVIAMDRIKVTREWEIEKEKKTTEHQINFIAEDSVELIQFLAVDYGITGFEGISLVKIN